MVNQEKCQLPCVLARFPAASLPAKTYLLFFLFFSLIGTCERDYVVPITREIRPISASCELRLAMRLERRIIGIEESN